MCRILFLLKKFLMVQRLTGIQTTILPLQELSAQKPLFPISLISFRRNHILSKIRWGYKCVYHRCARFDFLSGKGQVRRWFSCPNKTCSFYGNFFSPAIQKLFNLNIRGKECKADGLPAFFLYI